MEVLKVNNAGTIFRTVGTDPEPVMRWMEGEDGKRRPSDVQERDLESGAPIWRGTLLVEAIKFGRPVPELVQVQYIAADAEEAAQVLELLGKR